MKLFNKPERLTMFRMYRSASAGPDSCTLLATSASDSVRKVFVRRWMFFLYSDDTTCFTRPMLVSRRNESRYLLTTFRTSSLLELLYALDRSWYA